MGLIKNIKSRISLKNKEKVRNLLRHLIYFLWKLSSPFKEKIISKNIKNVLVINLGVIGDLLITTPMIRALNNKFHNIDVLMRKDMENVLSLNPNIHKLIFYEDFKKTLKEIKNKYELAIIFNPHRYEIKKLCKNAGIRYLVGNSFSYSLSDILLTARAKENSKEHFVQKALNQSRFVGADNKNPKIEFYYSKEDERFINNLLKKNKIKNFVVFHAGKRSQNKDFFWLSKNWAEIADYIVEKSGYDVIITGSSLERERNNEIMSYVKSKRVFNFCEKTNLKQLGCLLKKSKLLISLNTGMTHIASAFDKKMIVFNEQFPEQWRPWTNNAYKILLSPKIEEVKKEIDFLIKK